MGIKLIFEPVNGVFPEKQRHTSWDIQLHTLILTQLSVCADVCHRNGVFHWWMRYYTYMFHLNHNAISLHLRLTEGSDIHRAVTQQLCFSAFSSPGQTGTASTSPQLWLQTNYKDIKGRPGPRCYTCC